MTTSIIRRAAGALAAAAIALPIVAGSGFALAQTAAAPAAPSPAAAAPAPAPAAGKTALGDLRDMSRISVAGRVAEIFGNTFVIEDPSGRALVDLGPSGDGKPLVAPGETVTVEGRFDKGVVRAAALIHEDGRRDTMREARGPGRDGPGREARGEHGPRGPGPHGRHHHGPRGERDKDRGVFSWFSGGLDEAAATKALTDAGYKDVAVIDEGRHHVEFRAKDAAGQEWRIAVGDDNAMREREPFREPLTEGQARAAIEKLGYAYVGDFEPRREHVDVSAKTKDGAAVTVELNADGSLRKERFDD